MDTLELQNLVSENKNSLDGVQMQKMTKLVNSRTVKQKIPI